MEGHQRARMTATEEENQVHCEQLFDIYERKVQACLGLAPESVTRPTHHVEVQAKEFVSVPLLCGSLFQDLCVEERDPSCSGQKNLDLCVGREMCVVAQEGCSPLGSTHCQDLGALNASFRPLQMVRKGQEDAPTSHTARQRLTCPGAGNVTMAAG